MRNASGSALTEYALIGGLVVVASIAGLTMLGDAITGGLVSLQQDLNGGRPTKAVASETAGPGAAGTPAKVVIGMQAIVMADGTQIWVPDNLTSWEKTIETAGANGATQAFASTLKSLAEQALQAGSINEEQANLIKKLAEQGFEMAAIQKVLEDHALEISGANSLDWRKTPVTYQGTQQDLGDLSRMIGWGDLFNNGTQGYGSEAQQFQDIWQQVEASGALQDPVLKGMVDYSARQILNISSGTENATHLDFSTLDVFRQNAIAQSREYDQHYGVDTHTPPSFLTEVHATTICSAGGGTAGGTACQ